MVILLPMAEEIGIVSVEQDGEEGLIVRFTDGTEAAYVVEELLELRPHREKLRPPPEVMGFL